MWIQRVGGGGVTALAYAPDGRTLYTFDTGGWVTAWDTATRTGRRLPTNHRDPSWFRPTLSVLPTGGCSRCGIRWQFFSTA